MAITGYKKGKVKETTGGQFCAGLHGTGHSCLLRQVWIGVYNLQEQDFTGKCRLKIQDNKK
jgi:hypothetical protein